MSSDSRLNESNILGNTFSAFVERFCVDFPHDLTVTFQHRG